MAVDEKSPAVLKTWLSRVSLLLFPGSRTDVIPRASSIGGW
jgi:hypothetical protein